MGNFIGNVRILPDYPKDLRITVKKITSIVLGNEIEKIRDKGRLSEYDQTGIRFLKAAIHFIPLALEDGADFENSAFIFATPGRQFVVTAGKGDWEYYFSEDDINIITGRCVRRPWLRYLWNKVKSGFSRIASLLPIVGTALRFLMPT